MIKQQLHTLLEKEMNRKEFLKHVGIAAIALIGVPAVIKNLSSVGTTDQTASSAGYGSSAYGGGAERK